MARFVSRYHPRIVERVRLAAWRDFWFTAIAGVITLVIELIDVDLEQLLVVDRPADPAPSSVGCLLCDVAPHDLDRREKPVVAGGHGLEVICPDQLGMPICLVTPCFSMCASRSPSSSARSRPRCRRWRRGSSRAGLGADRRAREEKQALEEALAGVGAERQEAEEEELAAQLARLPDLGQALREAPAAVKRQVFESFELRIAYDKSERRVELTATVSEAVADAFENAKPSWRRALRGSESIAGVGFEPATSGL